MAIGKIDTRGEWMVNDQHIYIPSADGVEFQHENVAGPDSGRTEDGVMHIDWRRRDVRKVSLTYKALTGNEVRYMVGLMQGKEFSFTFMDGTEKITMNVYCGKCSYKAHNRTLHASEGGLYQDFKINVEEM